MQLNPVLDHELQWLGGSELLLVKRVPADLGPPPQPAAVPIGPDIKEAAGQGESSTYEARDTLESPEDESLFDYYARSQLAKVYDQVSAYFHADQINEPILIVHGADDANPGTETTQSPRLFQAIRGTGGTARLVMLPFEPHWYTARESNEHLVAEMLTWFDRDVKDAKPRGAVPTSKTK